jgi:hypothetical protein
MVAELCASNGELQPVVLVSAKSDFFGIARSTAILTPLDPFPGCLPRYEYLWVNVDVCA